MGPHHQVRKELEAASERGERYFDWPEIGFWQAEWRRNDGVRGKGEGNTVHRTRHNTLCSMWCRCLLLCCSPGSATFYETFLLFFHKFLLFSLILLPTQLVEVKVGIFAVLWQWVFEFNSVLVLTCEVWKWGCVSLCPSFFQNKTF